MNTTLTLDASGGLFLPAELLADAHLNKGAAVEVDVAADRILVKAVEPEREARIVRNAQGRLVIECVPPLTDQDIIRAIKADREERDERILGRVTKPT
jgi:antitoxin component of MazEF toxin-antitoxin module